jgi:hypothetical protein
MVAWVRAATMTKSSMTPKYAIGVAVPRYPRLTHTQFAGGEVVCFIERTESGGNSAPSGAKAPSQAATVPRRSDGTRLSSFTFMMFAGGEECCYFAKRKAGGSIPLPGL